MYLTKLDILNVFILPFHSSLSLRPHSKLECLETKLPTSIPLHFTVSFWHGIKTNQPERYLSLFICLFPPLLSAKEQWEQKALSTAVDEKAGYQPSPSLLPFAFHKGNIIFPSLFHSFRNKKQTRIGATGFHWLMVWWVFLGELLSSSCVSKH